MRIFIVVLLLGALAAAGCASSSGTTANPESAQGKCKGTWDDRTNTCIGG